jgi:hypothetical protein
MVLKEKICAGYLKMDWNRFCYPTVNSFNLPKIGTITINPENWPILKFDYVEGFYNR